MSKTNYLQAVISDLQRTAGPYRSRRGDGRGMYKGGRRAGFQYADKTGKAASLTSEGSR